MGAIGRRGLGSWLLIFSGSLLRIRCSLPTLTQAGDVSHPTASRRSRHAQPRIGFPTGAVPVLVVSSVFQSMTSGHHIWSLKVAADPASLVAREC